jgi:membrane fusion protein, heavy metal efflux system
MIGRWSLLIVVLVIGFALANFFPELPERIRTAVATSFGSAPAVQKGQEPESAERKPSSEVAGDQQNVVKLTEDESKSAGIELAATQGGIIAHSIVVPGTIIPHADRIAHVAVKLSGTVAELHKK